MSYPPQHRDTRELTREIKFHLDTSVARAVRDWARARFGPDPHGAGPFRDEYATSTLYFDTADLDVFHRRGSFGRSKYRVRRYGASDVVFCERKLRTAGRLVKRRTPAGIRELSRLERAGADETWPVNWFHQRLQVRSLRPICRVSYRRTARVGAASDAPLRLTLDDHLQAIAIGDLAFDGEPGMPIAPGQAILELKYHDTLPAVFKHLVEEFCLVPKPVSKYRLAIAALGVPGVMEAGSDPAAPGRWRPGL